MKPFAMKERVHRLGSTDTCPTADAKRVVTKKELRHAKSTSRKIVNKEKKNQKNKNEEKQKKIEINVKMKNGNMKNIEKHMKNK